MTKRIFEKGHLYDSDIYGDSCPLCDNKEELSNISLYQSLRPTLYGPLPPFNCEIKSKDIGRKLVGFLVTYNRTPMGKAYNIFEGRNFLGRDASCDIVITGDDEINGKHMLIRYLSGDGKYRFRDEMSSNGTYVNKQLVDEGELQNYDIIRVGKTLFIFIAIPQI